jgi:hypothetical protein
MNRMREGPRAVTRSTSTEDRPAGVSSAAETALRASFVADPSPFAPRQARRFVTDTCRDWRLDAHVDVAVQIADELVTNAVVHAGTRVELQLERCAGVLSIAVRDEDPALSPDWWQTPGRRDAHDGLNLVQLLSHEMGGHRHPDGGKVIWALLLLGPQAGTDQVAAEAEQSVDADTTISHRVIVNGRRPSGSRPGPGWRLELHMRWRPMDPDHGDLWLHGTPPHPALPQGRWHIDLATLRQGLERKTRAERIRVHPVSAAHALLFELDDETRTHVILVGTRHVRTFLSEVDGARAARGSSG